MDREQTDALILKKLDDLAVGQNVMNGEIKSLITKNEEQDKRHCEQIIDIKKDIEKGVEGRRVLHQKQDDIERELNDIKPTIKKVDDVFKNSNKIFWGLLAAVVVGVLITSLPNIIEVLK